MPVQLRRLLDLLDRLDHLLDHANRWVEPPESTVAEGPESIRSYFEDLFAGRARVQRNNLKVVIVGRASAGKTRRVLVLTLAGTDYAVLAAM